jgi:hypothetical protein
MFKGILDIAGHPIVLIAIIVLGGYFLIFPEGRKGRSPEIDMEEIVHVNSAYAGEIQSMPYQQAGIQNVQYAVPSPMVYPAAMPEPPVVKDVMVQEGHWLGLEVITLTPELAAANKIQENVEGVLVDEVTLLSARSGLLAGDVIVGIDGNRVRDLSEFLITTKMVKDMRHTNITIFRNGNYNDKYYGQCDRCHEIAPKNTTVNKAELGKDLGDTLAQAPPSINIASPLPHRYRGVCQNCHEILVN